jgi:hypothetical protein
MKVKELIEELQKANPESEVVIKWQSAYGTINEYKTEEVQVLNSSSILANVAIHSK